ncbi:kinase-like domain-containing protein, partial [Rhexocercosporidium sp. MPI-PUGE-AT-0058]
LKDQLYNARIEAHNRAHSFFVPRPVLEELISVPAVTDAIVSRVIDFDVSEATLLAEEVCKCGRRLFATLVAINKVADIDLLLKEGITDEDLPFVRKPDSRRRFALYRKGGQVIKTFESWRDQDLEQFDRSQWWMMAPIFRLNEGLQILDDNIILPFVPLGSLGEKLEHKQGGYSEVYPVRVHPAHHTFWAVNGLIYQEDEPLVAVKRLFSSDQMEFLKEAAILTSLSSNHHPHLIKLLATYKHEGRYHFMFPYANANLRTYWDDRPSPTFDRDTVLWSLRQMTGIANGLLRIHSFSDAVPLQADSETDMTRGPRGTELIARHGEAMFGRHGDLKPENLLWFRQDHESQDPKGILQIADFGLGRFHRRDSRSGINPETVQSSPTYEPPECKLRQPVSRAYDIWSLGCVFLEFMTWLLEGTEQIEGFSEFRGRVETNTGIDDDNFFTIVKGADGAHAVLREGVITWKDRLHTNENCSQLIHDLLDLTMSQLLVIDARKRCTSAWLLQQLRMYLQRAEHDEEYMLRPAPHAP